FPASSSTRMLNCSQLTSRFTKRAGLLRSASMSGPEASGSANSLISFIVFGVPVLFVLRAALLDPAAVERIGGDAAGTGRSRGECQPVHEVCKDHDFFGGTLHARHQIGDDPRIDLDLSIPEQFHEHL